MSTEPMSKKTTYTVLTPLPAGISRQTVIDTLHNHTEIIDLNPLLLERHQTRPPAKCMAEEFNCLWYSMTDKVQYLPGGLVSGKVTYSGCFHNLPMGLQTHIYAPMGLDLKSKWTLGGTLPHEPRENQEMGLGAPKYGLWLREDVTMKCNVLMTSFVKKTLKRSHVTLVDRLMEKAHAIEARAHNERLKQTSVNPLELSGSPSLQNSMPSSPEMRNSGSISPYTSDRYSYQSWDSQKPPIVSPPYWNVDPAYQMANPYKSEEAHSYQSLEYPLKRDSTPYQNQKPFAKAANVPSHDLYPIHSAVEMEG